MLLVCAALACAYALALTAGGERGEWTRTEEAR